MNNEHPIDKHFREGLQKYKAPVPQGLWGAIAADQAKKLRRQRIIRYGSLSLLSLLLLTVVGLLLWPESTAGSVDTQPPSTPSATAHQHEQSTDAQLNATSEELTDEVAMPTPLAAKPVTAEDAAVIINSNTNNLRDLSNTTTQVATASAQSANTSTQQLSAAAPLPAPALSTATTVTNTTNQQNQSGYVINETMPVLPLPRLAPYLRPVPEPLANKSFRRAAKPGIEIDLLGGFAYANQGLSTKTEETRDELNAREISEFSEVTYLAGLRVSYRLSDRFSLRTGVLYTQIRNQFEYDQMISPDRTILIRSTNQLRLLEVPLLLGYELPGRRFHLALNAGPIVNLSNKASGRYLLPNQMEPASIPEENIYRKNIGIGWTASLTAAYDLGMGNSLLIEPTFKSYPRTFTQPDYSLNETYWVAGLQVGLRHRIR